MEIKTTFLKGVERKMVGFRAGLGEEETFILSNITHHRNETKEDRDVSQRSSSVTFACSFTFSWPQAYTHKMGTL